MSKNKRLIAKIVDGENVIMTIDQNLLSVEFGALDRGNITDVFDWGIYANRGSILFVDNVGFFNNQNINSAQIKGYTVSIYLKKQVEYKVATFGIDNINFSEETKEVRIELVSKVASLVNENTTGSVYPFYNTSARDLLDLINEKCPNSTISIGADASNIDNTVIGCPYIGADTVWNVATKLCQATMSRIVETPNGDLQITSSFPKRTPIVVKPNNIIDIANSDFVRIEDASIDVTEREVVKEKILEGAIKNYSINWGEQDNLIGSDGFLISGSDSTENLGILGLYVNGSLEFDTPYKIYSIGNDESLIQNVRYYNKIESDEVLTDQYEMKGNICSNIRILNDTKIRAEIKSFYVRTYYTTGQYQYHVFVNGGKFKFPIYTFIDNNKETISIKGYYKSEKIQSNDLVQNISYYKGASNIPLGGHILSEVNRRYLNGIECFEIDCLFNDYYDERGNKIFNKENLSKHFEKYDIIIPYVKKRGQVVPLRLNQDGTPKKFRIIGISYSYDGLLKQKLSVQEERYDID